MNLFLRVRGELSPDPELPDPDGPASSAIAMGLPSPADPEVNIAMLVQNEAYGHGFTNSQ